MNWYDNARQWYIEHKQHVDKLIKNDREGIEYRPSLEDLEKPNLWKAGSWKWFLNQEVNND